MVEPLRHRQTKGAATDMPDLPPPRHIPTLPNCRLRVQGFLKGRELTPPSVAAKVCDGSRVVLQVRYQAYDLYPYAAGLAVI